MELTNEKIVEIRKSVNIVDIISEYIPLEQKGRNYFAVCPFHDDHNPSMSVSPEKQIYTCFVCGAHGNVFNFIMDYDHVSFIDALRKVADKVGIKLDINTPIKKTHSNIDSMYEIYDISEKFYQNNLYTETGDEALKYLYDRGFTDEIIRTFKVGLSSKNALTKMLKNKKYSDELLLKCGISSEKDGIVFDTFTNRIMFPLFDIEGRTVGFSGRIYNKKDSSKYVNSKESDIFKKGNLLYNYHRAKEFCRKSKSVIVVEGFMDVIALYMVGIYNVIAAMGTAITKEQARLISRLSENVILCFDGDEAGNKATKACSKELNEINIIPKVVRLPDNLDPDEFIKKYGVSKYQEYLDNATSLVDYNISELKKNVNFSDSNSVTNYVKNVVEEIENIDDEITKELIINRISLETNISVATIKGLLKDKKKVIKKKEVKRIALDKYQKSERRLIYYMIRYPEVIKIYEKNKCYFPTQEFRYLVNEIIHYYDKYDKIEIADFLSYLIDKEELIKAFNEIDTMEISEKYNYDEIMDYINTINEYSVNKQIQKLINEFKSETDSMKKLEIVDKISKLKVSE